MGNCRRKKTGERETLLRLVPLVLTRNYSRAELFAESLESAG